MQCKEQVPIKGMNFYRTRQCKNNAVNGTDFCKTHSPETKAKRIKEKEKSQKKKAKLNKAYHVAKLRRNNATS